MRTFEFRDGKSNKFWSIELRGAEHTVTFGKIGTKGQSKTKTFDDEAKAKAAHDKLIQEKLREGYIEQKADAPPPSPLQASLEANLLANPDDLAAYAAYADFLTEQGDPRGEFIAVQLALEDEGRSPAERKELQKREKSLLQQYGRQWLGDLGRFLDGKWSGPDKPYHYQFARGSLDFVRVLPFPIAAIASLARSPEVRLLRHLEVVYDMRYHPFDFEKVTKGPMKGLTAQEREHESDPAEGDEENPIPGDLFTSPYLTNLRVFKLGFSDAENPPTHSTMVGPFQGRNADEVVELLSRAPRLEELYLNTDLPGIERLFASPALGRLRILQYYFGMVYDQDDGHVYRLRPLADNPALGQLTHLRLHPGRDTTIDLAGMEAILHSPNLPNLTHLQIHMTTFGDDGPRAVIRSGIMRRLKVLDFGYGNMTDEGARLLASSPDVKPLELLDLRRNALTSAGVAALEAAGVRVIADNQHELDEEYPRYLDVDVE
jgi:uncharacterized protein (TIGR02996 family)